MFPFNEGGGPHISGSDTLLTQGFIFPRCISIAFLLGLSSFLPCGSGTNNGPFSALVNVLAIAEVTPVAVAFAANCVFVPPSKCACALAIDRGILLQVGPTI